MTFMIRSRYPCPPASVLRHPCTSHPSYRHGAGQHTARRICRFPCTNEPRGPSIAEFLLAFTKRAISSTAADVALHDSWKTTRRSHAAPRRIKRRIAICCACSTCFSFSAASSRTPSFSAARSDDSRAYLALALCTVLSALRLPRAALSFARCHHFQRLREPLIF